MSAVEDWEREPLSASEEEWVRRYHRACHAMQSGVRFEHEVKRSQDGSPKHLRVGVNSAMVQIEALTLLLMEKGLLTREEYLRSQAEAMEREVARYQERNTGVTFG